METRTEMLGGRFTKLEVRIVERLAKAQKMTVSNYVHGAVLTAAVADGDVDAMRLVGGMVLKQLAEAGEKMLQKIGVAA